MEWIKIEDRLPPQDGSPFLCYDPNSEDYGKIYVVIYVNKTNFTGKFEKLNQPAHYREASGEGYFKWNPSHWMPLPQPPKEN